MKVKKSILAIAIILFGLIIFGSQNVSKASTEVNPPLYMGVQEYRTDTDPANMAYGIGNPDRNGSDNASMVGKKIWDLVQYDSADGVSFDNTKNYYCIKAGVGFRNIDERATYNIAYDFIKDRNEIANSNNDAIKGLVSDQNDIYYKILAMIDLMYIPGESTEQEKTELINNALTAAGLKTNPYTVEITDTDLEAVQQAALWYFTEQDNTDLFQRIYNQLGLENTSWFTYKLETMQEYKSFSDYNLGVDRAGEQRQYQAVYIYNYLINTAEANAAGYKDGTIKPKSNITLYVNATETDKQPVILIEREEKEFDLSLRKYITKVDGNTLNGNDSRVPDIDTSVLENDTTAEYNHKKDPVRVTTGSIVTYNITVYNEGEENGFVNQIIDQLPEGLTFRTMTSKDNYTASYDEEQNRVIITRSQESTDDLLNAFDENSDELDSITFEIECEVTSIVDDDVLTNVAWISEEETEDGLVITDEVGEDRDSEPSTTPDVNKDNMDDYIGNSENKNDLTDSDYFYKGEQDDDDFEKLIVEVKEFDLKLIKKIDEVNGEKVPERLENVDVTDLANGTSTTADYQMNKEPVTVQKGDIVKYTLRVYNEGEIDGYASEITEDIPEGLEFLWSEQTDDELDNDTTLTDEEKEAIRYNQGIWNIETMNTETNRIEMISTNYLAKGQGAELIDEGANLIKAFDPTKGYVDTDTDKNPDYKEVSVYLKVVSENNNSQIIRNEAAITADTDEDGNEVDDRDSNPDEWVKYEDDEDYDNVKLQIFDLALRKFITGINDDDVTSRIPEVNYDPESDQITYEHDKTPMQVTTNDIVTYTIRVFNEGETAGYAEEVADDLPEGLEFLPDNEINQEYRWVMYDAEGNITEDVSQAERVVTDYLSKANGESMMEEDDTITENPNLLQPFNSEEEISETNPDYRDVKIAFRVIEPATSDKILTNSAQIEEDADENGEPVEDIDSTPGEWNEGEDDQDQEHLELTYFDLALRKWVTQAIVIENGKETITQTGHTPDMDPEPVVKVELDRKNLDEVVVKFRYSIRITNEGEIAGYATEITDYVPEGLRFIAEDNPGWTDEGNNIISTRLLENTLLQPGESADVEVVLTWINGSDNLGLKTNVAEISEDYNDKGYPDIDSTPDNKKEGEDDIDDAEVLLSISTGQARIYYVLGFTVLLTIGGGIVLIKRFVL